MSRPTRTIRVTTSERKTRVRIGAAAIVRLRGAGVNGAVAVGGRFGLGQQRAAGLPMHTRPDVFSYWGAAPSWWSRDIMSK